MTKTKEQTENTTLRYGWTTGACATAATKAAYTALVTRVFPKSVTIVLPRGQEVSFTVTFQEYDQTSATAGIIKDAGDDPDITHGALILATVHYSTPQSGIVFKAGTGVGTVTQPGLPVAVGQPAINPVPQRMMRDVITQLSQYHQTPPDATITLSIPNGQRLAQKTWNPRLGIVGGLSILGTTGIVVPYSCAAWIHSIHQGIDVARALGIEHIGAATGNTSEQVLVSQYRFPEYAIIDMGDFVGGMLKYLRNNPIPHITIAGGYAKMIKLAQGALNLHSQYSSINPQWIAQQALLCGATPQQIQAIQSVQNTHSLLTIVQQNPFPLATHIAKTAKKIVQQTLYPCQSTCDILIVDRSGNLLGKAEG